MTHILKLLCSIRMQSSVTDIDFQSGVIYASTDTAEQSGYARLDSAVTKFLRTFVETPSDIILWSMRYTQASGKVDPSESVQTLGPVIALDSSPIDLAFDDGMLDQVRRVWETIRQRDDGAEEFMKFTDREAFDEAEDGD